MFSHTATSRRMVLVALAVLCTAVGGLVSTSVSAFASALPDGRVYEMVTPAANRGADVYVPYEVTESHLSMGAGIHTKLLFQDQRMGMRLRMWAMRVGGTGETSWFGG